MNTFCFTHNKKKQHQRLHFVRWQPNCHNPQHNYIVLIRENSKSVHLYQADQKDFIKSCGALWMVWTWGGESVGWNTVVKMNEKPWFTTSKKSDKISKSVARTSTKCVKDFLLNQSLPISKISKKFIHNFLSRHNLADKQTDKQRGTHT